MRVISVNPDDPRDDRLEEAVGILASGAVVAFPTETLYGLGADAFDPRALARVNAMKGKPAGAPILLLLADAAQVPLVARETPPLFDELARSFWPGPLTVVVPAAPEVPEVVTGGLGTVALRVPGLALPRRLARLLGRPISGVSANRHGEPPCRGAAEVVRVFGDEVDLVLDGGSTAAGTPSTIVDLCGATPRILREGLVPESALRSFLPDMRGRPV